jgi:ferredoxin
MYRALLLLVLSGAGSLSAAETIWVQRSYIGGPLCAKRGAEINFVAPGTEAASFALIERKIRIYRSFFRNQPTCQACGKCPTYHREILFEIEAAKIADAEKAGFIRASQAPDATELANFERSKVYRPLPDLPAED